MKIMDCTLRDGANVVGNGFSAELTQLMLRGLTECHYPIIEFGNAKGIGAAANGFEAPLTDEEYLQLAQPYLDKAEIGMFLNAKRYVPANIDLAAQYHLAFLRCGSDAGDAHMYLDQIRDIKAHGLKAYFSQMKAYILSPEQLAEEARVLEGAGIDEITLMDSAGCMFPDEVSAAVEAMKKAGGAQEHEIQKVKKQMEKAQEALADQKEVGGEVPKSVKPGDLVHIASMDVDAIIVAPVDSKGYVQLKVGMMKMRAPLSDLRTLTATQQMVKKEQKKLERKKSMREARVDITTRAVRQELDVRGMALDEAIPEVEKFIDDAMLSSLGEVSIIHGNGTGVLRAGIQECLRRHPCVSSFRLGRYGEGETGVTIVSLK